MKQLHSASIVSRFYSILFHNSFATSLEIIEKLHRNLVVKVLRGSQATKNRSTENLAGLLLEEVKSVKYSCEKYGIV